MRWKSAKGLASLCATYIASALQGVASRIGNAHIALLHLCRGKIVNTNAKQQWDMKKGVMPDQMTRGVLLWYTLKKTQRIDYALILKTSRGVRSIGNSHWGTAQLQMGAESGSMYLKHISLASWQLILAGSKALPVWTPSSHLCTVNLIPCKQHMQGIPIEGRLAANLHGILHIGVCCDEMAIQMLSMTCWMM